MKIVVTISGGADSAAAACVLKEIYPDAEMYGVFVDYQQKNLEQERSCSKIVASKLEFIARDEIQIHNVYSRGGSSLTTGESIEDKEGLSSVYTPLRNLAIMGVVSAYANCIGADAIAVGSKSFDQTDDPYSFKDSVLWFYKMFESTLNQILEEGSMKVLVPLVDGRESKMSKREVYEILLRNGIGWEDTWSCFKAENEECGSCVNCQNKIKIKKEIEE